jgi:hypothetical protein
MKTLRLALALAGLPFLAAFAALVAQPQDPVAPNPAIPAIRAYDLPPEARAAPIANIPSRHPAGESRRLQNCCRQTR